MFAIKNSTQAPVGLLSGEGGGLLSIGINPMPVDVMVMLIAVNDRKTQ